MNNSKQPQRSKDRNRSISAFVFGKVPPNSENLERDILGAILMEKGAFDRVQDILRPECFYKEPHQQVFACMQAMAARSMPIDLNTLAQELLSKGQLDNAGGAFGLTKLTNAVVSAANIEAHARIILQKYLGREMIRVGGEMVTDGYEDTTDVFELIERAETAMFAISNNYIQKDFTRLDHDLIHEVKRLEELRHKDDLLTGVSSGFSCVDRCTSGWQSTDLIIIGARPSVGKTAFALNLARNAAFSPIKKTPVGFFSLEMSKAQLVQRLLAAESETELSRIRNARFDDAGMKQLYTKGVQPLAEANIYIDDSSSLNMFQLRSKARRMVSKHGVGLIIIDYLQLMTGDSDRSDNREREISKISRELKKLAKDLGIPIIALSQLSRLVENRGKGQKVPQLSDLRESGAIEQDADIVGFLYRPPDDEVKEDAALRDVGLFKLAKHRNGHLLDFAFRVDNNFQRWTEIGVAGQVSSAPAGSNWKPVDLETGKIKEAAAPELFTDEKPF